MTSDKSELNTLILGATTNESRYAYLAAERLTQNNIPFYPVGIKKGSIFNKEIVNNKELPTIDIDTITLYIGPKHQEEWFDYILSVKPRRIIFNPGTENGELMEIANQNNIEVVEGCTLVMLAAGTY